MLEVSWKNNSDRYAWFLGQNSVALPPLGQENQLPQKVLATNGFTTAQITPSSLSYAADMFFVWLTQIAPPPDPSVYWFATRLCQPVQVSILGYRPYWQICAGRASGSQTIPKLADNNWADGQNLFRTPVSSPAEPYNFDAEHDALPADLRIGITSVAGDSDLSLMVLISDVGHHASAST